MIKHIVIFRFSEDADPSVIGSVLGQLATFPDIYPAMLGWSMGTNISTRDDAFSHAFAVEFASEAGLLAYLHSESHEKFVREVWRPVIAKQAIVSYSY